MVVVVPDTTCCPHSTPRGRDPPLVGCGPGPTIIMPPHYVVRVVHPVLINGTADSAPHLCARPTPAPSHSALSGSQTHCFARIAAYRFFISSRLLRALRCVPKRRFASLYNFLSPDPPAVLMMSIIRFS